MADKRVFSLDTAAAADSTYAILLDKFGLTEAQQLTVAELSALLDIPVVTVTTPTITCTSSAAVISAIKSEKVVSGAISIFNIEFNYAGSGETDPIFSVASSDAGRPFVNLPILCHTIVGGVYAAPVAYMTGSTPALFTVKGTYQTATFRFVITIINS